jgi:hypothetical protein
MLCVDKFPDYGPLNGKCEYFQEQRDARNNIVLVAKIIKVGLEFGHLIQGIQKKNGVKLAMLIITKLM